MTACDEFCGGFENPELQPEGSEDNPKHRAIVRQAAAEAIVLLKNEGDLLPLGPGQYKTIANTKPSLSLGITPLNQPSWAVVVQVSHRTRWSLR